ncbi:MAG: hypothetical protein ACE5HU_04330 [Acidobacteriota bacterium]
MIRRILVFLLLVAAFTFIRRVIRMVSTSAGRARGADNRDRAHGSRQLVRDRVCNTFIPRDRAIQVETSGQKMYFCSQECRSRFLAGRSGGGGTAALAS